MVNKMEVQLIGQVVGQRGLDISQLDNGFGTFDDIFG